MPATFRAPLAPTLETNLARVRARLRAACDRAGRDPRTIDLIAVTKSVGASTAAELARLGCLDLGENRVQELERKADELARDPVAVRWHLIGHLQRNKARRALEIAAAIHSIDGARLLDALQRLGRELAKTARVYLEVKLVESEPRTGIAPGEVADVVAHARTLDRVELLGLMTLASAPDPALDADANGARARRTFRALATIARELPQEAFAGGRVRLSMGMSSDFEAAILAGSDCVRIGGALFEGLEREGAR